MSIIAKPNNFSPSTTASSSAVNDNFDTIYDEFNGNVGTANLSDSAVTTAKLADSNVTTAKVADSNVTTAKIADANVTSAKLAEAFVRGRFQSLTTNSAPTGLTLQHGFSFIQGTGANTAEKTITFPTAFSAISNVFITPLGLTSGSDPTAITSFNVADNGNIRSHHCYNITNSQFVCRVTLDSSATLASNLRAGFSWIALGTV